MKNFFFVLHLIIITTCQSQEKISIIGINDYLINNDNTIPHKDSAISKIRLQGYTTYRLLGAKSCNIDINMKYSNIYLEDGFQDEEGFYTGIFIVNKKDVCEITTDPYKINANKLSYSKNITVDKEYGEIIYYTRRTSMKDFKILYPNEYFRYELVNQNKVKAFEKCLAMDLHTPKSTIYAKNYYFAGNKIKIYDHIPIKYESLTSGIEGLPYLKEDKKLEFIDCINNLNILKISNQPLIK